MSGAFYEFEQVDVFTAGAMILLLMWVLYLLDLLFGGY